MLLLFYTQLLYTLACYVLNEWTGNGTGFVKLIRLNFVCEHLLLQVYAERISRRSNS
jgi:hypothetical protein